MTLHSDESNVQAVAVSRDRMWWTDINRDRERRDVGIHRASSYLVVTPFCEVRLWSARACSKSTAT